tara:strand:- start:498 stop:614 length:117 start_codon:yes stop_codon:yes gene_type:complete
VDLIGKVKSEKLLTLFSVNKERNSRWLKQPGPFLNAGS